MLTGKGFYLKFDICKVAVLHFCITPMRICASLQTLAIAGLQSNASAAATQKTMPA